MKRPAFQFYPGDWRKDAALQSCSIAARGLWVEVMCIAHECEPYGHLTVNGRPMDPAQIARLVGITPKECERLLAELADAGVSSVSEQGTIFSRRMVRDEEIRNTRAEIGKANGAKGAAYGALGAEHGKKGGRPRMDTGVSEPAQKPPQNPHPSSSSSASASAKEKAPSELVASAPPSPPSPPPFDGSNAEVLNGKSVVSLAADFGIPEQWGIDAEALGFKPEEVLRESERFRQYWTQGKGMGKRRSVKGWRQSWSNWLGKAAERR